MYMMFRIKATSAETCDQLIQYKSGNHRETKSNRTNVCMNFFRLHLYAKVTLEVMPIFYSTPYTYYIIPIKVAY